MSASCQVPHPWLTVGTRVAVMSEEPAMCMLGTQYEKPSLYYFKVRCAVHIEVQY